MEVLVLQLAGGLQKASFLFLLAVGLSLIFGVTRVINLAHGVFYMLGAYLAYTVSSGLDGSPFAFWIALVVAPLLVAALGGLIEIVLQRRVYGAGELYVALLDELDQILAQPPLAPAADQPAKKALAHAVARTYKRTAKRMRRAEQAHAGEPTNVALHAARRAAKRSRYAAEAVDDRANPGGRSVATLKREGRSLDMDCDLRAGYEWAFCELLVEFAKPPHGLDPILDRAPVDCALLVRTVDPVVAHLLDVRSRCRGRCGGRRRRGRAARSRPSGRCPGRTRRRSRWRRPSARPSGPRPG